MRMQFYTKCAKYNILYDIYLFTDEIITFKWLSWCFMYVCFFLSMYLLPIGFKRFLVQLMSIFYVGGYRIKEFTVGT